MNIQMQMTSAAQTIEEGATWLTSLFDEKKTVLDEMPEAIDAYSYPYQEMCFDHQNFDFLSVVNDTAPTYAYCDFG